MNEGLFGIKEAVATLLPTNDTCGIRNKAGMRRRPCYKSMSINLIKRLVWPLKNSVLWVI